MTDTVVPGRIGYLAPLLADGSANVRSPTLIMRDNRLNLPKSPRMFEVRAVRLHFKRHFVVVFLDTIACAVNLRNCTVRRGRRSLHQADEFVGLLFLGNDGLERIELFIQRVPSAISVHCSAAGTTCSCVTSWFSCARSRTALSNSSRSCATGEPGTKIPTTTSTAGNRQGQQRLHDHRHVAKWIRHGRLPFLRRSRGRRCRTSCRSRLPSRRMRS